MLPFHPPPLILSGFSILSSPEKPPCRGGSNVLGVTELSTASSPCARRWPTLALVMVQCSALFS